VRDFPDLLFQTVSCQKFSFSAFPGLECPLFLHTKGLFPKCEPPFYSLFASCTLLPRFPSRLRGRIFFAAEPSEAREIEPRPRPRPTSFMVFVPVDSSFIGAFRARPPFFVFLPFCWGVFRGGRWWGCGGWCWVSRWGGVVGGWGFGWVLWGFLINLSPPNYPLTQSRAHTNIAVPDFCGRTFVGVPSL